MEMGKRVVSWPVEKKKKTAQVYMHNDHWNWQGKKKVRILCGRVAKRKKNDFF